VREVKTATQEPLAIILADASLLAHTQVFDTAVNASTMALEIARLQAVVLSQLDAVQKSRTRIAEAGLEERRRIERDLHDGVQQRLLAVSARLGTARHQTTDPSTRSAMTAIGEELRASLESLRDLAHGIHPPELRQFGLAAAVGVLADLSPVPIRSCVTDERFPSVVEATAYFVVCEALANVAKHADASYAEIEITRAGDVLIVQIVDDGVGGTDESKGSGLTGLRDRVHAAGGQLTFNTPDIGGTTVRAEVPCE
jgi:signal transduction histidine kinase